MDAREAGIDGLLRSSMAAPIPSLPADFEQRLMRKVRHGSRPLDRYRRVLLSGYGVVSAVTSAVVMRGQGLEWGAIAGLVFAPVVLVGVAGFMRAALRSR